MQKKMEDFKDKALQQQTARQDAIRYERVTRELKCAREWQENWGFLIDTYPKEDRPLEDSPTARKRPRNTQILQCSLKGAMNKELRFNEENYAGGIYEWLARLSGLKPKEKYKAPITSSQEIGWNSDKRSYLN